MLRLNLPFTQAGTRDRKLQIACAPSASTAGTLSITPQRIDFLLFESTCLDDALCIWTTLGFKVITRTGCYLSLGAPSERHTNLIIVKGRQDRFFGAGVSVTESTHFDSWVSLLGATRVPRVFLPEDGEAISVELPGDFEIWLIKKCSPGNEDNA